MGTNHHSIIWRTLSYLSPYKKEFVFAGLLLAGATGIGFLQPLVIQEITDKGMMAQNLQVLGGDSACSAGAAESVSGDGPDPAVCEHTQ